MTVFFPRPINKKGIDKTKEPVKFDWCKDVKGGFASENLPSMIYQHIYLYF